jgi:ubiquinone/menaquinone biosynthesis C-methylase UbiE
MQLERFEEAYRGVPPWEIGAPQHAFVRQEQKEPFGLTVLDVGCGTGELAMYLASRGYRTTGVDIVPAAIEKARMKAFALSIGAEFFVGNALSLDSLLLRTFDTIVDSGVFHTFPPDLRNGYRDSLARVLKPGGIYYMLVWSERETGTGGPLRITQDEIRGTFSNPWRVEWIQPARFAARSLEKGARAWFAKIHYEGISA